MAGKAATRWRGRRAGALALGCAGIAAVLVPQIASAGTPGPTESLGKSKGLEYMTAEYENVDTSAGPPAECPDAEAVTGGGGSINGPSEESRLLANRPIDTTGSGWLATGTRLSGENKTVKSYAICGNVTNTYAQDSFSMPAGSSGGDSVPCATGTLTGGGAQIDSRDVRVYDSFPFKSTEWENAIHNDSDAQASVTGYAVCNASLDLRYRTGEEIGIRPGKTKDAIARCGKEQAVTGGGYDSDGISPIASRPWDSDDRKKVPDDGWFVRLHNPGEVARTAIPHAVCKR